jgi:hypothetical protein
LLKDLHNAIFDTEKVVGVYTSKNGSSGLGTRIELDKKQIENQMLYPTNVDKNTMGYGLTFMHELEHTDLSFDPKLATKEWAVIDRVNTMRNELNKKGKNYGQRQGHNAPALGAWNSNTHIIPFNEETAKELYDNGYTLKLTGKNAQFIILKTK